MYVLIEVARLEVGRPEVGRRVGRRGRGRLVWCPEAGRDVRRRDLDRACDRRDCSR